MAGCRLGGATGRVSGPVDVGADSPHKLDGPDLQRSFADNGAPDVEIRQPQNEDPGRPWGTAGQDRSAWRLSPDAGYAQAGCPQRPVPSFVIFSPAS
jgi:hypothetical protein